MQQVNVLLTIQHTLDGQTDTTRNEYNGSGVKKETGWFISYKEELEGVGTVNSVLKISALEVTLLRQGNLQMKQLFAKGKSDDSSYVSPYGRFHLQTHTRSLAVKWQENQPVSAQISYQLWLSEQYMGEYDMRLAFHWT